jgi:lipoyl synthase
MPPIFLLESYNQMSNNNHLKKSAAQLERPFWLRKRLVLDENIAWVNHNLNKLSLHTVCQEAMCPNQAECFKNRTAAFLIMGRVCTRNCAFCAIEHGRPEKIDPLEPVNVARAVLIMGLQYAVITYVTRDDLLDGGANHYAQATHEIRKKNPDTKVELLIPDFKGSISSLRIVMGGCPDVINHNLETVPSLYKSIRPEADYKRSLKLISYVKRINPNAVTKSGIMLGLGERQGEVLMLLDDLRQARCDILTIGQYLQPSPFHYPVKEYIHPGIFKLYEDEAKKRGFRAVASAPFVRSSYKAYELVKNIA